MKKVDFEYDIEKHEQFFFAQMNERGKRLYLGLEAMKLGYNGVAEISQKYNTHKHTVRRGKKELLEQNALSVQKVRQKGGGRKKNATP
jgi:predicted ArsR family transcriptional regulator